MNKNRNNLSWSSAREICIVKTLANSGHYPTRKSEKEAWFLSPLRSETQASFSVSLTKNLWFDYGLGKGGSIIDLIMAINDCSAYEAVQSLQKNIQFSFCPEKAAERKRNSHEIKEVKPLGHPGLTSYLDSRKIPLQVAQTFCKEIWHSLNDKLYFSIGLQNDSGGWEMRNKYYKCSTSPKTTTSILEGFPRLLIMEGMFDFLSLKVLDRELFCSSDIIVLNSLGNIASILEKIKAYSEVLLLLDNDQAGDTATKDLLSQHSNTKDRRSFYKSFKDLNNMLTYEREKK